MISHRFCNAGPFRIDLLLIWSLWRWCARTQPDASCAFGHSYHALLRDKITVYKTVIKASKFDLSLLCLSSFLLRRFYREELLLPLIVLVLERHNWGCWTLAHPELFRMSALKPQRSAAYLCVM